MSEQNTPALFKCGYCEGGFITNYDMGWVEGKFIPINITYEGCERCGGTGKLTQEQSDKYEFEDNNMDL